MTRFARAKGSKASNERVPEEATSWQQMKQQLEDKKQEMEINKKRKKAEETRKENYKNFLDELESSKGESWAEFEEGSKVRKKKNHFEVNKKFDELVEKVDKAIEEHEDGVEAKKAGVKKKKGEKQKIGGEATDLPNNKQKRKSDINLGVEEGEASKVKKSKLNTTKKKNKQPEKVKKPYDQLTEEEKKKVDKKRLKRAKQVEKRKLMKDQKEQLNKTNIKNNGSVNKSHNNSKKGKPPNNKEHTRRKPENKPITMNINGIEVKISYFDGFPIKSEDADRLQKLRKEMISRGIPRSELRTALKLERRKAEKALAREKKKVCFNCRKSGHVLSECPNLNENTNQEMIGTGVCFKCGSTEHTHFECKVVRSDNYKFATCFICKEQGHISRQCPDNNKGLYPKGGACRVCGDVTHLKKDCPKYQAQQEALNIQVDSLNFDNVENLDVNTGGKNNVVNVKNNKVVKF